MHLKRVVKTLLFVSVSTLGLIVLSRFCHRQTEGFQLTKIQDNLIQSDLAMSSEQDKTFLRELFKQKFVFFGRGLQSFAFASEDGRYVIKVFNNRYQQKIALFSFCSHVPFLGSWAGKRAQYYRGKLARTFNSYQLAFDEMRPQTGLIYTHLSPTADISEQIVLVDKLHIEHRIDPNQIGFLVQKRATLVFPALKEYITGRDLEGAKQAISSLIDLFFWKGEHAIVDNDPLIRTNYGFIEGKAVQLDVGPLAKGSRAPDPEAYRQEICRIAASLKFWLTENGPELIPFLDRELQQPLSWRE